MTEPSGRCSDERWNQREPPTYLNGAILIHVQGAIRWTLYGATACVIAHFTWPFFRSVQLFLSGIMLIVCRRQTLALKGFITSSGGRSISPAHICSKMLISLQLRSLDWSSVLVGLDFGLVSSLTLALLSHPSCF